MDVSCEVPRLQEGQDEAQAAGSDITEYSVKVKLRRIRGGQGGSLPRAYAPKFPKVSPLKYQFLLQRAISETITDRSQKSVCATPDSVFASLELPRVDRLRCADLVTLPHSP